MSKKTGMMLNLETDLDEFSIQAAETARWNQTNMLEIFGSGNSGKDSQIIIMTLTNSSTRYLYYGNSNSKYWMNFT
jgi:hypothetical protein